MTIHITNLFYLFILCDLSIYSKALSSSSSSSESSNTTNESITLSNSNFPPKVLQSNATDSTFYSVDVGIDQGNLWFVNTSITGQEQQLRLDIAQPYVWVVNEDANPSFKASTYKVNESNITPFSSYEYIYNMTFIDYIDLNMSAYISNMTLDDSYSGTIGNMQNNEDGISANTLGFFVANDSYTLMGAFGIGGKINNTNWQETQIATNYFNDSFLALEALKNEGVITNAGYSLWLAGNSGKEVDLTQYQTNSSTYVFSNFSVGSLMLNYVNNTLFTGDLVKFESIPYYEVFDEGESFTSNGYPIFPLSGAVLVANDSETANLTLSDDITPILFDSRYTSSYLPIDIIQQIAIQTNAYYVSSLESWYVACELGNINAHIKFLFGQLEIEVPLKSFIVNAYMTDSSGDKIALYFKSYSGEKVPACILKMKPSSLIGVSIFGQPFLKYTYLAADLETNEFAIAQAAAINGDSLNTQTKVKRDVETETTIHLVEKREATSTTSTISSSSTSSTTSSTASSSSSSSSTARSSSTAVVNTPSNSSSSSSSSTSTSNATAQFISSGYIPFAKSSNISATSLVMTKFSAATTQSKEYGSNVLELFGYNFTYGSIFSNGEIVTATRSFFDTNLPSVSETTISASTSTKSQSSSSVSKSVAAYTSYFTVAVEYETYVVKSDSTTTEYETSATTIFSTVVFNKTATIQSNHGNGVHKYTNGSNILLHLIEILGITGFIWSII
ncbi:hypothetical protein ACO0SA_000660 [Hanseniaspora valbyensis]